MSQLKSLVIDVFDNPKGKKLLEILQHNIWIETPTNNNNTNEYILIAGKKMLLRDIQTLLNTKGYDHDDG